jgi:hypothetical protein
MQSQSYSFSVTIEIPVSKISALDQLDVIEAVTKTDICNAIRYREPYSIFFSSGRTADRFFFIHHFISR